MRSPINLNLVKHPMNWFTILLMVIIAGSFGHLALSLFSVEPKEGAISSGQSQTQTA